MQATVRVADSMNAQEVANSLWAVGTLRVEMGGACGPLLQQVPRVYAAFMAMEVRQVITGLEWLEGHGGSTAEMRLAWKAIERTTI